MSTDPMRVLAEALAPHLRALLGQTGHSLRLYSQCDGERPTGCGKTKYLRAWRRALAAGDAGATRDGRARLLTPEAYARHAAAPSRAPAPIAPVATLEDEVLAELGGVPRARRAARGSKR